MKKFNIILIVCLALISISSACSKDEYSPYTREQVIGKWNQKSFWIVDSKGNGEWINAPDYKPAFLQFNANGTFYITNVFDDRNSSWSLKGITIYAKTTSLFSDELRDYIFEIISLNNTEMVLKNNDDTNIRKVKFIKE